MNDKAKIIVKKRYVFEFNDKNDRRTWHILCFNGAQEYACKSFSCDDSYRDDADDYVEEFLKNGGNHYKYNIPWDMYYDVNKEDYNNVYVLPDKPLSNLEEYRVYPEPYKEDDTWI